VTGLFKSKGAGAVGNQIGIVAGQIARDIGKKINKIGDAIGTNGDRFIFKPIANRSLAGDNVTGMTLPGGRRITYTRDPVRRIATITTTVNGVNRVIEDTLRHRADNQLTARRFGNGPSEQRRYDLQGRLLDQTLGAVDARNYQYDANGNILARPATPQNKTFAYDSLDRLIDDATNGQAVHLGYDPNGNRMSRAANDGSFSEAYAYSQDSNRLGILDKLDNTAPIIPLTPSQTERAFTYNNTGRLFQVFDNGTLTATYIYNGNGLRTRKITAAGITLYHYNQQGKLIEETREDGTPVRDYIRQDNEPVAQIDIGATSESLIYLHTDHLGTPRLATNPAGTVVWRWEGEAFGQTLVNEDPDGDGNAVVMNLRFPGQYYDQETGLHYNYFRYYDPSIGRYLTADPLGAVIFNVDDKLFELNHLYVYAENNAINVIDPFGLIDIRKLGKKIVVQTIINAAVGAKVLGLGALTHSEDLGCSSFDCNNNGIPDSEEKKDKKDGCQ